MILVSVLDPEAAALAVDVKPAGAESNAAEVDAIAVDVMIVGVGSGYMS